jgi:uncharacterized protein YggE
MKWSIMAVALLAPGAAWAQQNVQQPVPSVTVSANATVEREPERAQLLLAVETTGPTAREASQANATRMDALIAALRGLGISGRNVRTTSYNLQPVYARNPREPEQEPRITGYRAMNMVQVTIDSVARVGAIIDGAVQAGGNRVAGLNFELKDPDSARVEALRQAVAKARAEAQAVAQAAGQRLGTPLNITTGGYAIPFAADAVAMRAGAMQDVPTPIEPGTLKITAQVTITFRLESN